MQQRSRLKTIGLAVAAVIYFIHPHLWNKDTRTTRDHTTAAFQTLGTEHPVQKRQAILADVGRATGLGSSQKSRYTAVLFGDETSITPCKAGSLQFQADTGYLTTAGAGHSRNTCEGLSCIPFF